MLWKTVCAAFGTTWSQCHFHIISADGKKVLFAVFLMAYKWHFLVFPWTIWTFVAKKNWNRLWWWQFIKRLKMSRICMLNTSALTVIVHNYRYHCPKRLCNLYNLFFLFFPLKADAVADDFPFPLSLVWYFNTSQRLTSLNVAWAAQKLFSELCLYFWKGSCFAIPMLHHCTRHICTALLWLTTFLI